MDLVRKQLDALMGSNRNGELGQGVRTTKFTDADVCHYYLCGLCPHELFVNTKMDLGECPKMHSEHLRHEYEEARKTKYYPFEEELESFLGNIISECDRKIENSKKKLQENEDEKMQSDPIGREISDLQLRAEQLGEEGKVDEYMALQKQIEQLKQKKVQEKVQQIPEGAAGEVIQAHGPQSQQQKLRVCDVCGCYLSIFDSDRRLADHFSGKLHMGYLAIRDKLKELEICRKQRAEDKRKAQEQERDRRRDRSRDIERTRRDRERDSRERDRERESKRKTSSRDRDRSRERDRSRDKDKDKHKGRRR